VQKGRHFVYATPQQLSQKERPLSALKNVKAQLHSRNQRYLWVSENAYVYVRFKQRSLSLCFTPKESL